MDAIQIEQLRLEVVDASDHAVQSFKTHHDYAMLYSYKSLIECSDNNGGERREREQKSVENAQQAFMHYGLGEGYKRSQHLLARVLRKIDEMNPKEGLV